MPSLRDIFTLKNPLWTVVSVLAVAAVAFLAGGLGEVLFGPTAVKAANALVAVVLALAVMRLARYLNLTINKEEAQRYAESPVYAGLRMLSLYLLGFGVILAFA